MPPKTYRPTPPPVNLPMTPLAIGGTFLWLLAAGVLSLFSSQLAANGNSWWIDCALWGAAFGIPGTLVMVMHDRKGKERDAD